MYTKPTQKEKQQYIQLQKWRSLYKLGLLDKSIVDSFVKNNVLLWLLPVDLEKQSNEKCVQLCQFIIVNGITPKQSTYDFDELNLARWLNKKRRIKNGKIKGSFYDSDHKIAQQYGLVNLFDQEDLELESNKNCVKTCEFILNKKKEPSRNSSDSNEYKLGTWLSIRRAVKNKTGTGRWYESDQKIAESYGLNDLFQKINHEKKSNELCIECCEFLKTNNRIPDKRSSDEEEKKIGIWLGMRKQFKKNNLGSFYDSDQQIAESYGFQNLFEIENKEIESNNMCKLVCQFFIKNKILPNSNSKNKNEKDMCVWLHNRRQAFKGNNNSFFYDSDLEIAKTYGIIDLFETRNLEKISNDKTQEVCDFVKSKGHTPRKNAEDKYEKSLGNFLSKCISRNFGWYPSNQIIAEKNGLPHLFFNLEEKSNMMCHKVCNFINANKKLPSQTSHDVDEYKLGIWLSKNRQAKKADSNVFYQSNEDIAISYGLFDLFEIVDPEKESNKNSIKLCEFVKQNFRNPNAKSQNTEERKLGIFLQKRRGSKKGIGRSSFYDSDQKIAEQAGLPNLFN